MVSIIWLACKGFGIHRVVVIGKIILEFGGFIMHETRMKFAAVVFVLALVMGGAAMSLPEARRLLGVASSDNADIIRSKFRAKALREHPDKGGGHVDMAGLVEARDLCVRMAGIIDLSRDATTPTPPTTPSGLASSSDPHGSAHAGLPVGLDSTPPRKRARYDPTAPTAISRPLPEQTARESESADLDRSLHAMVFHKFACAACARDDNYNGTQCWAFVGASGMGKCDRCRGMPGGFGVRQFHCTTGCPKL